MKKHDSILIGIILAGICNMILFRHDMDYLILWGAFIVVSAILVGKDLY